MMRWQPITPFYYTLCLKKEFFEKPQVIVGYCLYILAHSLARHRNPIKWTQHCPLTFLQLGNNFVLCYSFLLGMEKFPFNLFSNVKLFCSTIHISTTHTNVEGRLLEKINCKVVFQLDSISSTDEFSCCHYANIV